jgi:hypothetical protein
VWLATAALLGCAGGSETGNPALPTPISLGVRSSDVDAIAISQGAQGTLLAQAWVAFGEPVFLDAAQCARFGNINLPNATLKVADLAQPDVRVSIHLHDGTYCGVALPLQNATTVLPDGAPSELLDHSILLRGKRADATPFSLAYPEHDELELAAVSASIHVTADSAPLLLSFDVATWMDGVDLDSGEIDSDGVIRIDAASNPLLLNRFEQNLACSLELYADQNGDAQVDGTDTRLARCATQ